MTTHNEGKVGQWTIKEAMNGNSVEIYEGKQSIATCWAGMMRTQEKAKDNAHLIAAAPELLKSAKELLELTEQYIKEAGPCDHSVGVCICGVIAIADDAEQAISKATGGER